METIIGIFDSGVGGMTTMRAIQDLIPKTKILYYRDSDNCPYGDLDQEKLNIITSNIVSELQKKGVKIIVIACNTATTRCIHFLRQQYPNLIFIGTEPAIKVAADQNFKNILLMATTNTIKSEQVRRLVAQNITNQDFRMIACPGLANIIEDNIEFEDGIPFLPTCSQVENQLDKLLLSIPRREKIDAVILGCTHYNFLSDYLPAYFPNATFINSNQGVAKQTLHKIHELNNR